jgi:hypothetical protein
MHKFHRSSGWQGSFPIGSQGGGCKQHNQWSNSFACGFPPRSLACPPHVIGKHLVKVTCVSFIKASNLILEFFFDCGQHDLDVLF